MLLEGKKALIMGVANNRSIAWGITQEFKKAGAVWRSAMWETPLRNALNP